jgi:hypothetical protein
MLDSRRDSILAILTIVVSFRRPSPKETMHLTGRERGNWTRSSGACISKPFTRGSETNSFREQKLTKGPNETEPKTRAG